MINFILKNRSGPVFSRQLDQLGLVLLGLVGSTQYMGQSRTGCSCGCLIWKSKNRTEPDLKTLFVWVTIVKTVVRMRRRMTKAPCTWFRHHCSSFFLLLRCMLICFQHSHLVPYWFWLEYVVKQTVWVATRLWRSSQGATDKVNWIVRKSKTNVRTYLNVSLSEPSLVPASVIQSVTIHS